MFVGRRTRQGGGNLNSFHSFVFLLSFFLPALGVHVPTQVELPEDLACFARVAYHFLGYDYQLVRLMGVTSIEGLIKLDPIFDPFETRLLSIPPGNLTVQEIDGFPFFNHISIAHQSARPNTFQTSLVTLPFNLRANAVFYTLSAHDFFSDESYHHIPFFNTRYSSLRSGVASEDIPPEVEALRLQS